MIGRIFKLSIGKYFVISMLASVIDFAISYLSFEKIKVSYLFANNAGIISGFLFQYTVSNMYIFETKSSFTSFMIYLTTFLLGIVLANGTIFIGYDLLNASFLFSKVLSMVVPFFVMYFIRKRLLGIKSDRGESK